MIIVVCIIILLFAVLWIFTSKRISPIPYFPSNKKDSKLILKSLEIKNNQILIDLGAGDGWIVFEAAHIAYQKKLNTKFIATDINPILLLIMQTQRLFHPNKKNISVRYSDMFKDNYKQLINNSFSTINTYEPLVYLYISPWYLENVVKKIKKELTKPKIVTYFYEIKSLKPSEHSKGIHDVFVYNKV